MGDNSTIATCTVNGMVNWVLLPCKLGATALSTWRAYLVLQFYITYRSCKIKEMSPSFLATVLSDSTETSENILKLAKA